MATTKQTANKFAPATTTITPQTMVTLSGKAAGPRIADHNLKALQLIQKHLGSNGAMQFGQLQQLLATQLGNPQFANYGVRKVGLLAVPTNPANYTAKPYPAPKAK